ncbi:SAP30-binding protein [Rhynchospora pubera]|uniref:SAP30-binding protein n=1 Tax=Rhynchospora pubera TaxID=906938 RepID=A0AAV8DPP5_9POAL|nr:SAP30-binding protein [Rhynchospora pubera]
MASEPERITALFSMYSDDDDEEENDYASDQPNPPPSNPTPSPRSPLQPHQEPSSDHKTLINSLPPTPSQIRSPLSPPSQSPRRSPVPKFAAQSRGKKGALGIVDYGHDEMAVSPEHDEGEGTSSDRVHMFREDMQKTSSPIAGDLEKSKLDAMAVDFTGSDHEMPQTEETGNGSANLQQDDLLSRFLGAPLTTKCSEELQQKINKFLAYKRAGRSFNAEVRNRKDYRNPDFLQHAVRYQDIDQIGTCFSKEVFNPHGYDKSDYYDEIEADMKREQERKEQERKKSPKVDFVSAGIQPPTVIPILKTTPAGLPPAPATGDSVPRETRNKKSKWDKVEGDVKNSVLPAGAAAVLSQAAVGGGYSGFVVQFLLGKAEFASFHLILLTSCVLFPLQYEATKANGSRKGGKMIRKVFKLYLTYWSSKCSYCLGKLGNIRRVY